MLNHDKLIRVKRIWLMLCISITFSSIFAQVTNVQYQIKYDSDSCWYDAFLIIGNGSAMDINHRTQASSKFSVVVPTGTIIDVIKNYMPLENNQAYDGTVPVIWNISSVVGAPTVEPNSDFYRFSPSLDSVSHYNNLNTGDTIKLFSISLNNITDCGSGIRIFENGVDPGPMAPGMGFINFSNQFNLLESTIMYDSNATQINPQSPVFSGGPNVTCDAGIEIDISVFTADCQEPLSYQWYGPNNFGSISQDVSIYPATTLQSGLYKVIVNDSYGCKDSLVVNAFNKPLAGDDQVVCANSTATLSGNNPATGVWSDIPTNPAGSTITNLSNGNASVVFDQNAVGIYQFVYSAFSCSDTMEIIVLSAPMVEITGDAAICLGTNTLLSPSTGGFWTSTNPLVASVNNSGFVTGISEGTAEFIFTDTSTGCSATSDVLTVHGLPSISIIGTPNVCVGSTTTMNTVSAGTWESSFPHIATIDSLGTITGISLGTSDITFLDTITGCSSIPEQITVLPVPTVSITGINVICTGAQTSLSPVSGGTWVSLNPGIAAINDNGIVTGLTSGTSNFMYTETTTGCTSDTSDIITIMAKPVVNLPTNEICEGSALLLNPVTGGTWVSSNTDIATVGVATGIVTSISQGPVTFTFTQTNNGCSSSTDTLTVNKKPQLSADPTSICIGSITTLSPSSGGTWTSLDSDIALIFGNIAAGVNNGIVTLRFEDNATGCENTINITVSERAAVNITGDNAICMGQNSQLSPSSGGIWSSSNPSVATVNNEGVINGISGGSATFIFTEIATGCNSLPTPILTVYSLPDVSISGLSQICIGSTTTLIPESGGIWTSNNQNIATVDPNSGIVTGIDGGTTTFVYTSDLTGCTSLPSSPVIIYEEPVANIAGPAIICIGGSTLLSPSDGGTWVSGDPSVATVTNTGIVSGSGSGTVSFTFTETANGCGYTSTTANIFVTQCFNPDFNITSSNVMISGNISTNDHNPSSNEYNPGILLSSPAGSNAILNMNTDGSYTFQSDSVGRYVYKIPVCIPPLISDCPESELIITVVKHFSIQKSVSANVDLAVTWTNTSVNIPTLQNDVCVLVGGCQLDPTSVNILGYPVHGSLTIHPSTGDINYTPYLNYMGIDTLIYEVCVLGQPLNCSSAKQIISIINISSDNSTHATDDLYIGSKDKTITGNVLLNDMDAESDQQSVFSQQTSNSDGDFTLQTDGSFTFVPQPDFTGTTTFIYEVCDDHIPGFCRFATLYIFILPDLSVHIRAYLEGSLMNNANATAGGRPLMRDNLRMSPFNGSRYIPDSSPYKFPTEYINITNKFNHVGPGALPAFQHITDPSTVFSVTGPNAIVDWVFIELRSKVNKTTILASRAGLLQRDGDVVELDGVSALKFPGTPMDDYYVVLRHRSHLGVMTATAQTPEQMSTLIDFTSPSTPVFDFGTTKGNGYDYTGVALNPYVKSGYMAMYAGDFDANKKIKTENPNDDLNTLFFEIFIFPGNTTSNANFDFAIGYLQGDFDMNSKAKFDNPNDDKNMLYIQLLFYPINVQFLSNFNFFIEQIP